MPIYEYDCDKCQKRLEITQKITDPALETCPGCGGKLTKLISMTSFQLKGSGWYATDYKKSQAPKPAASTPAAPAAPAAGPKKPEN